MLLILFYIKSNISEYKQTKREITKSNKSDSA